MSCCSLASKPAGYSKLIYNVNNGAFIDFVLNFCAFLIVDKLLSDVVLHSILAVQRYQYTETKETNLFANFKNKFVKKI